MLTQKLSGNVSEIDNKATKRSRKKSSYKKINNETREKLIEMVS